MVVMFSRVSHTPRNLTRCEMAQRLQQSECCVGAWVGVYNFLSLSEVVSIRSWFHTTKTNKQRLQEEKYSLLGRRAIEVMSIFFPSSLLRQRNIREGRKEICCGIGLYVFYIWAIHKGELYGLGQFDERSHSVFSQPDASVARS